MSTKIAVVPFLLASLMIPMLTVRAQTESSAPVHAVDQWNVPKKGTKLAIQGYDPVAYFPEGGGAATKGSESINAEHQGVTYRFSNEKNKEAFVANPEKYEPAHGGWCSWAMREGDKVEIDPKNFIVKDDRLFLFYKSWLNDTRAQWLKQDHATEAGQADAQWKKLSGEDPRVAMLAPTSRPLAEKLSAKQAEFAGKMRAETSALYERGIKDVGASGVLEGALRVGAAAPDFTLPDANGQSVTLSALLAKGPVVLTWYRGGWCPYCNIQLQEYQRDLSDFQSTGAQLVAISPQTPDNSLSTKEKNSLQFHVLSDAGSTVAKRYGVAYTLPEELTKSFKGKLDLAAINGDASNQLPITATYVIDPKGVITWAFVSEDYRTRAEPADVLAAVRAISTGK
jgi:peroxiredoxin/YHS domain-containing protein